MADSSCGQRLVRVDHKLLRRSSVEVLVTLRSLVERDNRDVAGFGGLCLVVQNSLHELPVVAENRALPGVENTPLRPSQTAANAERHDFRSLVHAGRISAYAQP